MGITCNIDDKTGIVYTTIRGRVSTREVIETLAQTIASPNFRPGLNGLADMRESHYDLVSNDVRQIAALMAEQNQAIGPSKTAIVVSSKLAYGMARMYQAFAQDSSIETQIFDDIDEAKHWLGII